VFQEVDANAFHKELKPPLDEEGYAGFFVKQVG
jgi:hypothetical protein